MTTAKDVEIKIDGRCYLLCDCGEPLRLGRDYLCYRSITGDIQMSVLFRCGCGAEYRLIAGDKRPIFDRAK